jgi:hypothetical protein
MAALPAGRRPEGRTQRRRVGYQRQPAPEATISAANQPNEAAIRFIRFRMLPPPFGNVGKLLGSFDRAFRLRQQGSFGLFPKPSGLARTGYRRPAAGGFGAGRTLNNRVGRPMEG